MRTALDGDRSKLDEQERTFVEAVETHGWFRTSVMAEDEHPSFSYTTGFTLTLGAPEVLIHSLRSDLAHDVLWDLFRDLKAGKRLVLGRPLDDILGNHRACFFAVARRHYRDHLGWSRWFYGGDPFDCLQLVWPDRDDVFPWEPGFDAAMRDNQVDLSETGWLRELA
jgi:hypothetical protein